MKLCVLVPALNCADSLSELRARTALPGPDDEMIIVDDASTDDTLSAAQSLSRVHAVRNESRSGYGGTSHRLYQLALARGVDVSVNVHGDLGHRPEDIPPLLAKVAEGYDIVLGSRLLLVLERVADQGWTRLFTPEVSCGMPPTRVLGHLGLTWFQNKCFGTQFHSFHEGMRACSRRAIEWAVNEDLPRWYNYDLELLLRAHRAGLRIGEVPVCPSYDSRAKSAAPRVRYGLKVVRHAAGAFVTRKWSGK